jgi:hypothetical protein
LVQTRNRQNLSIFSFTTRSGWCLTITREINPLLPNNTISFSPKNPQKCFDKWDRQRAKMGEKIILKPLTK